MVQYVVFSKNCQKTICKNREGKHLNWPRAGIYEYQEGLLSYIVVIIGKCLKNDREVKKLVVLNENKKGYLGNPRPQ